MLKGIIAYVKLNIKSLLKDKISFIWSIFFPLIIFYLNYKNINQAQLVYWWEYMIICSFVYGIGIYIVELRENGCLKTYFSIKNSKTLFFLGNLFTQIIFCIISLEIFNAIIATLKGYNFIIISSISFLLIILSIPLAFASLLLSLPCKISSQSVKTIFTILTTLLLFGSKNIYINKLSILSLYYKIINDTNRISILIYIILSAFSILIGINSLSKLTVVSEEKR